MALAVDEQTALPERCPHCDGPVEHGFVCGDRGLFWDTKIRHRGFPAEMLTRRRLGPIEPFPAVRCRTCRLVTFQLSWSSRQLMSSAGRSLG